MMRGNVLFRGGWVKGGARRVEAVIVYVRFRAGFRADATSLSTLVELILREGGLRESYVRCGDGGARSTSSTRWICH